MSIYLHILNGNVGRLYLLIELSISEFRQLTKNQS